MGQNTGGVIHKEVGHSNFRFQISDFKLAGTCPTSPVLPACGRQGRGASLIASLLFKFISYNQLEE
jgi:hypothetical protein